ncbi:MAG: aldo/keto reductase [Halobacteriales archaeon]
MATRDATWAYRDGHDEGFARAYWRLFGDAVVSSIGVGTYLGDATDAVDRAYEEAIIEALEGGVNVVDTAINYRHQRSERAVGAAVERVDVDREAVVVATKGGFVPFDGTRPDDPARYLHEAFLDPGLVDPDDLVGNVHSLAPDFLDAMVDRSLSNLGLDAVDCYYVHNPEFQLRDRSRAAVYDALEAAFARLERRAAAGDLAHYGVATWEAFRVPPDHEQYLSLPEVHRRAQAASDAAGTETTHFQAVQLPFNVRMADAFTLPAHEGPDGRVSALEYASRAGLDVFTSASIGQGDLADADALPDAVAARLNGETPAQRALNFARSAPGVTTSLVGNATREHVRENVAAGEHLPMDAGAFDATFE